MATVTDDEIRNYFATIPANTSDEEIVATMEQFDVSPSDIGRALNATPEVTQQFEQRYREAGGMESLPAGAGDLTRRDVMSATQQLEASIPGTPSDLQYVREIDRLGLTPEQYAAAINQPGMAEEFRRRYDVAKTQLPSYDVPALDFSGIELTGDPEQDRKILANAIMSGSLSLTQRPFEFYPEERVVPFTEQEEAGRARTLALSQQGVGTPEVERALEVARDVAGYTPGLLRDVDLTPYQSQYQQGVTDIALRELDRQRQMRQQDIADQAIRAGAFGGARQGVVESELERTYAQQAGDIATRGAQAGLEFAQRGALADLAAQRAAPGVQLQGAAALSQGANQLRQMGYSDAEIATTLGQTERALAQSQQDVDYRTFLESQAFPAQQLSYLAAPFGGMGGQLPQQPQFDEPSFIQSTLGGLGALGQTYGLLTGNTVFGGQGSLFGGQGSLFGNPFG
jgi:hypothetical protein